MASSNEVPRFRVSDIAEVPLRGFLLRLKVVDGAPRMEDLKGSTLIVRGPDGDARVVTIRDFAVMAGRSSQERLERYGEIDVIVSAEDAVGGAGDASPIRLGWTATPQNA